MDIDRDNTVCDSPFHIILNKFVINYGVNKAGSCNALKKKNKHGQKYTKEYKVNSLVKFVT